MIDLTHHNVEEIRVRRTFPFWLGLWHLEHPIATLGTDLWLFRVRLPRHTDRRAVVIVPDTDSLHRLGVVDVVLVMLATARLGLTHGTREFLLATDASVPHRICHNVVTALPTRGAGAWAS